MRPIPIDSLARLPAIRNPQFGKIMEKGISPPHPDRKRIIFITGGARSGKSRFAEELARQFPGSRAYLATAQALDEEMAERVRRHRKNRSADWQTLEVPLEVPECISAEGNRFDLILLDCLTLWVSNLMMAGLKGEEILAKGDLLVEACRKAKGSILLVGNEVGMGIVPDNAQARMFRDLSGLIQQKVAREADEVYLLVSGIAQKIKGA
jgi:adenosylcobinamide kinase/adenosylcobinamide-phosphate guanylyltransferase